MSESSTRRSKTNPNTVSPKHEAEPTRKAELVEPSKPNEGGNSNWPFFADDGDEPTIVWFRSPRRQAEAGEHLGQPRTEKHDDNA